MAVHEYGRPLEWTEFPEPELAPGQALLEVLACGVCFSDVKTSRGRMPFSDRLALPHVPGHEVCARVVRSEPASLEPGTTVVVNHYWPCGRCARCRAGIDQQCSNPQGWVGFMSPGGFQERLVVPIDRLTVVPPSIDPIHAAPLTCALGTGYRAVVTRGGVVPGSVAVVVGLGGVGIHALQVAAATGARAIGIDVSPAALAVAHEHGLEAFVPNDPDAAELVSEVTKGSGADVVIDTVGSEATFASCFQLVRTGGRIVGIGYGVDESIVLPSARFVLEEVELVGSRYVALDELERAISLVERGLVTTIIDRVLPLDALNDAFEALESGEVVGRVVMDVAGVSSAGATP